ncbi:tetraacyldisaccharide 4'-kinase [Marinospirillum perlucidum]|uniref:tetraacyldisaccharide 4'-kinase n=1 Tax=Marinospirillum perlucidum TaxID=1982602 RepID=UPI000DF31DA6|nr:tetraacyldisaccharide 4'-kinase [Marinospirillum perlucidum]
MQLQKWIESHWYAPSPGPLKYLSSLEGFYCKQVSQRKEAYAKGTKKTTRLRVPVIIVGNLSVGGSGKSPVVAALARFFRRKGYQPGIVSRGYGSKTRRYPFRVESDSSVKEAGDEPLMLARQTGLPVAIDPRRPRAAELLLEEGCDLIIADDGLQHLALERDIEILVIDGQRGLGNGHCLPVGPLREPPERLGQVDWLLCQGELQQKLPEFPDQDAILAERFFSYRLERIGWRRGDGLWQSECPFEAGQEIHALAGIGHPQRFFDQLAALGLQVLPHPQKDHASMNEQTLALPGDQPIVMTAKDAVKLGPWLTERHWVVEVEAHLPEAFLEQLSRQVAAC